MRSQMRSCCVRFVKSSVLSCNGYNFDVPNKNRDVIECLASKSALYVKKLGGIE